MESNYRIIIPEKIYEELNSIALYYEDLQKDLSLKFLSDWEVAMKHLEQTPMIFQIKRKNFRSIQFNRFPFLIIFEVEKTDILIYKLIHAKRNPNKRFRS